MIFVLVICISGTSYCSFGYTKQIIDKHFAMLCLTKSPLCMNLKARLSLVWTRGRDAVKLVLSNRLLHTVSSGALVGGRLSAVQLLIRLVHALCWTRRFLNFRIEHFGSAAEGKPSDSGHFTVSISARESFGFHANFHFLVAV